MKAIAVKKYIRSSPRKMRLVIDLIRGKKIDEAISLLKFNRKTASVVALETLKSAIGNLMVKSDNTANERDIIVSGAFVNQGPTMKRISPAPMGRAYRIKKRMNHLTIEVSDGQKELKAENL